MDIIFELEKLFLQTGFIRSGKLPPMNLKHSETQVQLSEFN